jgi:hypothetical protein
MANDMVNTPPHYHKGGIDVIEFCEKKLPLEQLEGFYRMSVMKYITRYDQKGKSLEDLRKASFYLNKLTALYELHETKEEDA